MKTDYLKLKNKKYHVFDSFLEKKFLFQFIRRNKKLYVDSFLFINILVRCEKILMSAKETHNNMLLSKTNFISTFIFHKHSKFHYQKVNTEELKKMSKMANMNEEDLFEFDFSKKDIEPPISLFEEIEADLCDAILHGSSPEDDETDRAIDFIKNIGDNVKSEFEGLIENGDKKKFLNILTKIFTILLSVKADNSEKIIKKIVKLAISAVLKTWSELN